MAEHISEKTPPKTSKRKSDAETERLGNDGTERKTANHSPKKKKAKKSFPFGGLIFMFFLIAAILAGAYFGMDYMDRYAQIKGEYESALKAAEAERDAAMALRDEADPDSAPNAALRQQVTDEMILEANAELDALREQKEAAESAIRAEEEKIDALGDIEDFDYYRAIYDEYVEGRAYVEELLSGD